MSAAQLFEFESDFVDTLRCVPMAVRMKLDLCGIKLTLRQWSRLTVGDRVELLHAPCTQPQEISDFRDRLAALVERRSGEAARPLAQAACEAWRNSTTPSAIRDYAAKLGMQAPGDQAWSSLTDLQRFALAKLARDNHDNVNFVPALREFGLI